MLTPPATVLPSLRTKGSQSAEHCKYPQAKPGSGWRIKTLISLKVYPVALGLVTSFLFSFNLHKHCQVKTVISRCPRIELKRLFLTILLPYEFIHSLTHSFIQQILIECLLCASSGDIAKTVKQAKTLSL